MGAKIKKVPKKSKPIKLTDAEKYACAWSAARDDPNILAEGILTDDTGRRIRQAQIHVDMQDAMRGNDRLIVEVPREHGKTTQMLIYVAWLIGNNPNIRIKIVCSADDIAVGRGRALQTIIDHPFYNAAFPHIQKGNLWTASKFTVKRELISPEPTLECSGVGSKATGGRADVIILDDVDDSKVVVSAAQRIENRRLVESSWLNLLSPTGKVIMLCTPWHLDDTAHAFKTRWPVLRRAVGSEFEPVWPERWGTDQLKQKLNDVGSTAYAQGFQLIPINPDNLPIKPEWFRYFEGDMRGHSTAIICDPAISKSASADYTAIEVLTLSNNTIYLLELIRDRIDFPTTVRYLTELGRKYQGAIIGVESVAYQKAIPDTLKAQIPNPIVEIQAHGSKYERILGALALHIENGRVYLRGDGRGNVHPSQKIVFDECTQFPVAAHDDTVDALNYGCQMLLTGNFMAGYDQKYMTAERGAKQYLSLIHI